MKYCANCGNKLKSAYNYCPNCGEKPAQNEAETLQFQRPRSNRWVVTLILLVVLLIIAIAAIVSGLVIWLSSDSNTLSNSYEGISYPTYTPITHQVDLIAPQSILASGVDSHAIETIQAGSIVSISWNADTNVDIYILTETQYPYFHTYGTPVEYIGHQSNQSGFMTCHIANTGTYYLVISRPGNGAYSSATIYSAMAAW